MLCIQTLWTGSKMALGVSCEVCQKYSAECKIKRCSGCKLALYCSKEHQKQDWPKHKEFCKTSQKVTDIKSNLLHCEEQNECLRTNVLICQQILGRELTFNEVHLFYKRYCVLCDKLLNDIVTCTNCNAVVYCSESHREMDIERHSEKCFDLKLALDMNRALTDTGRVFAMIKAKDVFRESEFYNMGNLLNAIFIRGSGEHFLQHARALISCNISYGTSILYAMYKCRQLGKIKKTELTIHIVGNFDEDRITSLVRLLCLCLPRLRILNLVFISPKLKSFFQLIALDESDVLHRDEMPNSFKSCQINKSYRLCLYSDYVKRNASRIPDVIIGFNCGFFDEIVDNNWKDSFLSMCSFPKTVIAFTSFAKEISIRDFLSFRFHTSSRDLVYVASGLKNPWGSKCPFPTPFLSEGVIRENDYITVLHTK